MPNHQPPLPISNLPRVAVIVLTWNGRMLTMECLQSLVNMNYPEKEIILVDNGSNDGTEDAVRSKYGDAVTVIQNGHNLGFSRGNNRGIEYARRRGAGLILLLNNDTAVDPDIVGRLVDAIGSAPNIGIAGPKIYYHDPPDCIWFAGGKISLWKGTARHRGIREKDSGQYDSPCEIDYVTGCAMMIKTGVIAEIGLLDPAFEAYFEDTDLCMRARAAGYRIVYAPKAKVWHKISQSTGGQLSRKKIAMKLRSSFLFFKRYAKPYHWLVIPIFFFIDAVRILCLVSAGRIKDAEERQA